MREATITFEQVAAAAENIKAEGGKATSRAVRDRLSSGSMGTVNKLLQEWKSGQSRKIETGLVLPAPLQRAILDFMDAELTVARAQLREELAEQEKEASDLADENERQAAKIAKLEEELEARIGDGNMKDGQIAQLYKMCDALREDFERERASAEHVRTELAKAQLKLEGLPQLEQEVAAAKAQIEQERKARTEAEKQAAVYEAKHDGLAQMLEEAKTVASREITDLKSRMQEIKHHEELEKKKHATQAQPKKKTQATPRESTRLAKPVAQDAKSST